MYMYICICRYIIFINKRGRCSVGIGQVLSGEHHHLPVACVMLLDVLYHPYFKDRLARQVAYIAYGRPPYWGFGGAGHKGIVLRPV